MTTGILHDQTLEKQIEKQMGCMAGFLHLFDRHQVLTGKRHYSAQRLPPALDSRSESEKAVGSPAPELRSLAPEFPTTPTKTVEAQPKSPLPFPIFEFKAGTRTSWKFSKEAPRLSLDSRAIVDAKGSLHPREIRTTPPENSVSDDGDKHRRSPSVIARLMGLEPLQNNTESEPVKKAELRRSASESRVSRDLRFIDSNNFQLKAPNQWNLGNGFVTNSITSNAGPDHSHHNGHNASNLRVVDPLQYSARTGKSEMQRTGKANHQHRKSFFEPEDFFPEPKHTISIYGEIEKRLKMRGIDEPAKDLETLKQILEALQLKGLLHMKKTSEQFDRRNIVYDRNFSSLESPIVVMKPSKSQQSSPTSSIRSRINLRRESAEAEIDRNRGRIRNSSVSSPSPKSSNSIGKRKALNVESQRKTIESTSEQRRISMSPVQSPELKRTSGSDQSAIGTIRSQRNKKATGEIVVNYTKEKVSIPMEDESSTFSTESSISTLSQTDTERSKIEDYKEGRSLLERCDKLLHSIAEITSSSSMELQQPSPVSVLDSSFYNESSSPSPVMKRTIDFKDKVNSEDEIWNSGSISPVHFKTESKSNEWDYEYVSEILRASNYLPEDSDIFLLLEKQHYIRGNDTSESSRLQRRLIFDTISEILDRNRQLPPWKAILTSSKPKIQQIWSEFIKIRQRNDAVLAADDLLETICGVLRKDLAGDGGGGWGENEMEVSDSVSDIERQIFKDLIGETIRDLAYFGAKSNKVVPPPRRKLVF
ncbi:protein of unknown function DUF4378 [Dillenia turbinata]|uniref:DUF4378 domain-containing protein n=1 Tax=Dillenia turbinata TaxID=194707 RepID=A0AAN8W3E2_9MAGN